MPDMANLGRGNSFVLDAPGLTPLAGYGALLTVPRTPSGILLDDVVVIQLAQADLAREVDRLEDAEDILLPHVGRGIWLHVDEAVIPQIVRAAQGGNPLWIGSRSWFVLFPEVLIDRNEGDAKPVLT